MRDSYSRGLVLSIINQISRLHLESPAAHGVDNIAQYIKSDALHVVADDPLQLDSAKANLFSQSRDCRYTVALYSQIRQIALEFNNHSRHTSLYIIKRYFGQVVVTLISLNDCIIKKYNRQYINLIVY